MNTGEEVFVDHFLAMEFEDDFEYGEDPDVFSMWDEGDLKIDAGSGSVKGALAEFCSAAGYAFDPSDWTSWYEEFGLGDEGRFDGSFLVRSDSTQADQNDIDRWKRREMKLYACHVTVWLKVRTVRELSPEECKHWKE